MSNNIYLSDMTNSCFDFWRRRSEQFLQNYLCGWWFYSYISWTELEARLNATDAQAETQRTMVAQLQIEVKGILTQVEIIALVQSYFE